MFLFGNELSLKTTNSFRPDSTLLSIKFSRLRRIKSLFYRSLLTSCFWLRLPASAHYSYACRFHPPSASKISPTALLTFKRCRSRYRGATRDTPMGMPLAPWNPGTLMTGLCSACLDVSLHPYQ